MTRKVSIIIPTFNEQDNIARLLKSIKKQTYANLETIVVDDASSDRTVEVAKSFSVTVYSRKHAERSVQRNYGASRSTGDYLLFLDADMELSTELVKNCVEKISKSGDKALIIPEKTAGDNIIARVRRFERDMYKGDASIEVARFFDKKVFKELGGYDRNLTGAEDYDLPRRLSKKYSIGWATQHLTHHEERLTFMDLLRKKYYYASKSVDYAQKHPDLVRTQGTIIFRPAYFRNWRKFIRDPFLGMMFVVTRSFVTLAAVLGFIKGAGFMRFIKTFILMFKQ